MVHSVMFTSKLDFDLNFRSDIGAPNSESLSEEYPYLSEIKKLKQTTEQLNGAIESAAKELSGKVDDTALQAEIKRATGVETELSNKIGAEETRATVAENALEKRIKAVEDSSPEALAKRVGTLEETAKKHTTSINELTNTVSEQKTQLNQVSDKANANALAIEELQKTVSGHISDITDLKRVADKITDIETTVNEHSEKITSLQNTVSEMENSIIDIFKRLSALENNAGGMTAES